MGYLRIINHQNALESIRRAVSEIKNPYNDGFNQWLIKQELLKLKWSLDELLDSCPEFAGEQEFVKEYQQKRVVEILSDDL